MPCLVDIGSMVSTITEICFQQHFEPWGQDRLQNCQEADTVKGQVIKFWEQSQRPGLEELRQLNKPVLTLLQQWNRLEAREGVLYLRVIN